MVSRAMKTCILLMFLCGLPFIAGADELSDELLELGFIEKEVPVVGSNAWLAANRSAPALLVELSPALVVRTSTADQGQPAQIVYHAGSVKYIGVNHGEFGGGLYTDAVSDDSEPLLKANVRALVPVEDDLYIVSGLAHLAQNSGAIHVIRDYRQVSAPEQVALLPDAPETVMLERSPDGKHKIVIAGHASLMVFRPDSPLETVVPEAFWSSLYPGSMVKHRDHYIIGIRSGLAAVKSGQGQAEPRYFVAK